MKTSDVKQDKAVAQNTFKLIEGEFSPENAAEVLFNLIRHKIVFHERNVLSCEERNQSDKMRSKDRVDALKEARQMVEEMIREARQQDLKFEIESKVELRLVPKA